MLPTPVNGSRIRAHVEYHDKTFLVLCQYGREWVTWEMDNKGHCYWGNYSDTSAEGLESFRGRIKEMRML